ncbi:MAG: hypothetical protein KAY46_21025, partial [Burkholderiaceae bacterium]|nr:hypothetical protein [Burkholderiaceae bacterium]
MGLPFIVEGSVSSTSVQVLACARALEYRRNAAAFPGKWACPAVAQSEVYESTGMRSPAVLAPQPRMRLRLG